MRPVPSVELVASRPPSGDQVTPHTVSECPRRTAMTFASWVSTIRTLWSEEAEASICPSGDQAMFQT